MRTFYPTLFGTMRLAGLAVLSSAPCAWAQQPSAPPAKPAANIVSLSPAELFYKTQLGFEHQITPRSSLGISAMYRYGSDHLNVTHRYRGGQATAQYRYFLGRHFPTGLYLQLQAAVYNHRQEANLINRNTYRSYSFKYNAVGGGGGFGWGYRAYLFRKALSEHLMVNTLVGMRLQNFPHADYDATVYRPQIGFLGNTDETNWYMGNSPGSFAFGLLTLDYQF